MEEDTNLSKHLRFREKEPEGWISSIVENNETIGGTSMAQHSSRRFRRRFGSMRSKFRRSEGVERKHKRVSRKLFCRVRRSQTIEFEAQQSEKKERFASKENEGRGKEKQTSTIHAHQRQIEIGSTTFQISNLVYHKFILMHVNLQNMSVE